MSSIDDRMRLHITPFNADVYDRIIPSSLQPLATGASFHTIQTSPEKGYGFVELPSMEAQKLRKKLNGSTLKGTKMSVEEARPAKKRKSDEVDEAAERKKAKREKGLRKKEAEHGVLVGHEMEEGRRVKRGWTGDDSRDGKKKEKKERKAKSVDVDERKLKFKTKVPPNKTVLKDESEKKMAKKEKKAKKGDVKGQVVVEEFQKRRKSRKGDDVIDGAAPGSRSYVEGKGWVDEDGNVIEPERKSKRRKKQPTASPEPSSSADSKLNDATVGAEEVQQEDVAEPMEVEHEQPEVPTAAGSKDDSGSDTDSSAEDEDEPEPNAPATTAQPKEIHPLEALFKRSAPAPTSTTAEETTPSRPRPAPIDTSFSFFGPGADEEDGDTEMAESGAANGMPPATPHTKRDLEWRSLRSAAPTPDTAAIGRKFSFPFAGQEDEDEDEGADGYDDEADGYDDANSEAGAGEGGVTGGGERGEESAFRKWFFENRGDLNRGWKKRRREERKVRRQRENRRVGMKVA